VRSWPSLVGLWSACLGWHRAAFVAVTNSPSNSSSHSLFTPPLETAFDLLERAHALALEMPFPRDGIHRRSGETVLNLQPVPHHALEQFALRFRHGKNLPLTFTAHKARSPMGDCQGLRALTRPTCSVALSAGSGAFAWAGAVAATAQPRAPGRHTDTAGEHRLWQSSGSWLSPVLRLSSSP